jgi:hypothetical protein
VDPVFGSTIIRVTDAVTKPGADVQMFSDAADSMWNREGTMFIANVGGRVKLFGLNRVTRAITDYGNTWYKGWSIQWDGLQWDATDPGTLYATDGIRTIFKIAGLPGSPTRTNIHDFTAQIPLGGFPSSRIGVSPDARYFMLTASTFGGQDQYNYVSIWDKTLSVATTLNVSAHFGGSPTPYLHSGADFDNSAEWVRLGASGANIGNRNFSGEIFWHWKTNEFSSNVSHDPPDYSCSHKTFGTAIYMNACRSGDEWLTRSMATPHAFSVAFTYPRKLGPTGEFYTDSHSSRILADGGFSDGRNVQGGIVGFRRTHWESHAGAVYKVVNLLSLAGTAFAAPDTVWWGLSTRLTKVTGIPTGSGQFFYDAGTDVLYLRMPNDSNPAVAANLWVFDWRPMAQEVVYNKLVGGVWTSYRIAHHRARKDLSDFNSYPLVHPDPQGQYFLFASNWDGSARKDLFIAVGPTGVISPPANRRVGSGVTLGSGVRLR